jgi:hypothetical protein
MLILSQRGQEFGPERRSGGNNVLGVRSDLGFLSSSSDICLWLEVQFGVHSMHVFVSRTEHLVT